MREGYGQYAPMAGAPELTRALAERYRTDYALDYDPASEITVTSGATEAIFSSVMGLVEPGDEVILLEPFYDSYHASVVMAGASPVPVTLRAPEFRLEGRLLRAAVTPRTKAILLNTPHNPTGRVVSEEELAAVAAVCREHDLLCLSDEVYEHLVYEGRHVPIATLPGMRERTVTISSFGKTFSLTGWKVGWASAPPALSAGVRAAHQFVTFATATPLQHGAAAALLSSPAYFEELRASYREKRDRLTEALAGIGFAVRPAEGTYFAAAGFAPFGFGDDVAFCRFLVEEAGVAAIPPSAFSLDGRKTDWVRFAFCKTAETLDRAIERLSEIPRLLRARPRAG
jgi:N-succinyldiaminopimelate aminotransferase